MNELKEQLIYLKLNNLAENIEQDIEYSIKEKLDNTAFIKRIIQGEYVQKIQRASDRRVQLARIPVLKTIENFNFAFPKTINREMIMHLFNLNFIKSNTNVILCGEVGTGKTHIASALALTACQSGYKVLFTSAVDIINKLRAAQQTNTLVRALRKYQNIQLLVIDELGYMPIDKNSCDLLFQVFSSRYEKKSTIITTNRVYKDWPIIFNNDATVTSAVLDRLLHHVHTIKIEGESYRMKD